MPLQMRFAPITSVDKEARTVDVVWTTGARVRRYDWRFDRYYLEELSLDPAHIRMERLASGRAPFLNSHASWDLRDVIGVVERAWDEGGKKVARIRFSKRDDVEPIYQDIADGILPNVSVGYRVHRVEMIPPVEPDGDWVYRAVDWEPYELSSVAIGADLGAHARSEMEERATGRPTNPCQFIQEENAMPNPNNDAGAAGPANTEAIRAERTRVREIMARVHHAGLPQELGDRLVESGCSLEAACRQIVDAVAEAHPAPPTCAIRTEPNDGGPGALRSDLAEGIVARVGGPRPSERAKRYATFTLTQVAAACLEARGVRTSGLSVNEIVTRAMGTSDFVNVLGDAQGRRLRAGYEAATLGVRAISREQLARDFRTQYGVALSEGPALDEVPEGGEYKHSKLIDGAETFQIRTYGKIISVTRQGIVNDDLSAFDRLPVMMGGACREKEASALVSVLTTNAALSDGGALFNSTAVSTPGGHANLSTGTGSALSATSLAAAVKSMRLQRGLDLETPINIEPIYLIVPAALEYTALQLVAMINPTSTTSVNPFAGKLTVVVDPRLDSASGGTTAWYLSAGAEAAAGLIHAYLQDRPGPIVTSRESFETDELQWRVTLDFAASVEDFRGLHKANGA